MPRALKTYITSLGFFELAVAAPSMKAALEAWGMSHNAFQQGFAQQSDDPRIIEATTAQPGVVLKRAVGTRGEFREDAELPTSLPAGKPPKPDPRPKKPPKPAKPKREPAKQTSRADIISFEKARAKREKARAAEEARLEKLREARARATDSAEAALQKALVRHEKAMALIEAEREKMDRRAERERDRWSEERARLEAALDRAGK